jgi:hypothetical protein
MGPHPVSLLLSTKEVVGLSQASVDSKLLDLPDPYLWHAISTFNTYTRGPTHRSLTDTVRSYNHLRAPPDLRLPNLDIASSEKVIEAHIADSWSFDHSASTKVYIYA